VSADELRRILSKRGGASEKVQAQILRRALS